MTLSVGPNASHAFVQHLNHCGVCVEASEASALCDVGRTIASGGEPPSRHRIAGAHGYTQATCPNRSKHTKGQPETEVVWHAWADKKQQTHDQVQCPVCGFWCIWKKRLRSAQR